MSESIEQPQRVYLAVPYEAREQAKALGARWDREAKSWYVPPEKDPEPFAPWRHSAAAERDPRQQFADELRKAGFQVDDQHPIMDGKIHRVPVEGDKAGERNGSYRGFLDGVPNGWHQNFKTTEKPVQWKSSVQGMTEAERLALLATATTNKLSAEKKRDQAADLASQRAIEILSFASPAVGHAYLTAKQVRSHGLFIAAPGTSIEIENGREIDISGRLLVPIRDINGAVSSLQIVDDRGGKMFLRGGKIAGGQHVIGQIESPWPLLIAEGYATAATVHEATGHPVIVAFNAHNLGVVAAEQRAARPDRSIFIAGDNDKHLTLQTDVQGKAKRNVGAESALSAAAAIDGHALIPAPVGDRGTDWNDARKERGMAAIRAELSAGLAAGARRKIARDIERQRGYGRPEERERGREMSR
jgi:putative DNA primase/helicase